MALLGDLCLTGAFVLWLIILIDAFRNETWKGILGLFFRCYLLYYALFEFQHKKKWSIVCGWLFLSVLGHHLLHSDIVRTFGIGLSNP